MVKKKNALLICYLFSFLHGGNCAPASLTPTVAIQQAFYKQSKTAMSGDYNGHQQPQMRDVLFTNDLHDLYSQSLNLKPYAQELENINLIVKAVNEYTCPRNEIIEVTIKNNELVVVIKEVGANLLYECIPIEKMLPKEVLTPNLLEKYLNIASRWATKLGLYVLGKTVAKFTKCTIIIHNNVDPNDEHIPCTEVLLNLHDLAEENMLHVEPQPQNILNMNIIIREKAHHEE